MVEMHADDRNEIDRAQAGDILAIVGMKNVQTGHTLCDPKDPVTLEPMIFPEPVISIAVKPKDKGGSEKMGVAIGKMIAEDPSFRVETDEDSGETILKGMGELHLDIKVDILKRTYGVDWTLVSHRLLTVRRSLCPSKTATRTRSSLVVLVSLVRSTTASSLASQVQVMCSAHRLLVVTFLRNSSQRLRRASAA